MVRNPSNLSGLFLLGKGSAFHLALAGHILLSIFQPAFAAVSVAFVEPVSEVKILPDSTVEDVETRDAAPLQIARGEFEPLSFVVWSSRNESAQITSVDVSFLDPDGSSTNDIEADVRVVKRWYQGESAWDGRYHRGEKRVLIPELLLKDESLISVDKKNSKNFIRVRAGDKPTYADVSRKAKLDRVAYDYQVSQFSIEDSKDLKAVNIPAGENRQLWVTIRAKESAVPAQYKVRIFVSFAARPAIEKFLALEVLPFQLPQPSIEYSIYYRGKLSPDKHVISSERKTEVQLAAEFQDMHDHGISNPNIYQNPKNKELFLRYMQIRREVSFDNTRIFLHAIRTRNPVPVTDEQISKVIQAIESAQSMLKPFGVEKILIYGVDEARGKNLEVQLSAWAAVKGAGAGIFVAGHPGTFETVGNRLEVLVLRRTPDEKEIEAGHALGSEVYSYNNPQSAAENPLLHRRNYGLLLWQKDVDGFMNYAYQASFGRIWNDFDHIRFRDHAYTYPTINGVIPTLAWEGLREAIDDVRYVTFLEQKLAAIGEPSLGPYQAEVLQDIKRFLSDLRDHDLVGLSALRREIIEKLMLVLSLETEAE